MRKSDSKKSVPSITNFISPILNQVVSISAQDKIINGLNSFKKPMSSEKFDSENLLNTQIQYTELVSMVRKLFVQVNRKYFEMEHDDVQERFKRKQDEFGYEKIPATHLVELTMQLVELLCQFQVDTSIMVREYKLIKDCDEESRDYLWLIQKSERDMREAIRENQQLKQQIENLKLKIGANEKQLDLVTSHTQKAMEEMQNEFSFAIDILDEREQSINCLKKKIKHQEEVINSLEEQLISILILEHKISFLGTKYEKDKEKTRVDYEQRLKNSDRSIREQMIKENSVQEIKISQLQKVLKSQELEKKNNERDLKSKLDLNCQIIEQQNLEILKSKKRVFTLQNQIIDLRQSENLTTQRSKREY